MILLFHVASVKVTQCYSADLWSLLVCPRWFHSNVWSLGRKTQMAGLPGTTVPNSYTCPFRFSNLGIIGLIIPWIKTLRECSKRLRLNHSLLITQPLNFQNIPIFTFSIKSCKEAAAFPLLMRDLAKITGKLYLFFHSIVFMQCPSGSKLTIFTAHLFYIYKYTEYCFIQSSSPYILSA